jgi:hypothetical protein
VRRTAALAAFRALFPPTYGLLWITARLASAIRRAHPLAPLLLLVWVPARVVSVVAFRTCAEIAVALR